jgi:iron complex transport system ATP-binding protein
MSIKINKISYGINNSSILKDISLEIRGGEILSILGPNGSGKSTLMKVLAGDINPNSGSVVINGTNLNDIEISSRAIVRSMMSQAQNIVYDFDVREIIEMGWIESSVDKPNGHFENTLTLISNECGIDHLLKRKYNSLSGGEQRMVHFARTLLQSNGLKENLQKYIFFDEPTANLDIKRELNILNVIRKKAKEGYGIFIVLHDLNLAYNFSDRIVLIKDGRISKMGDPNEVFDDEILSEVYEVPVYFDKDIGRIRYY